MYGMVNSSTILKAFLIDRYKIVWYNNKRINVYDLDLNSIYKICVIKLYDLWIHVKSEKVVCCILKKMIHVICMCIDSNLKKTLLNGTCYI